MQHMTETTQWNAAAERATEQTRPMDMPCAFSLGDESQTDCALNISAVALQKQTHQSLPLHFKLVHAAQKKNKHLIVELSTKKWRALQAVKQQISSTSS